MKGGERSVPDLSGSGRNVYGPLQSKALPGRRAGLEGRVESRGQSICWPLPGSTSSGLAHARTFSHLWRAVAADSGGAGIGA